MNIDGLTEEKKNDIASIFKRNLIIIYMKCSYKFLIFFCYLGSMVASDSLSFSHSLHLIQKFSKHIKKGYKKMKGKNSNIKLL